MSDVECPSNEDSDEEKNEENLNIKEEPYDPDFDGPKHCARNTSFVAGQRTETTLGKSSLRDDPNRTSNTNNTGTTEAQGEQSASSGEALNSNTFPVLSKVKSEPGSEPEKYETVCAKPKAEPKTPDYNAILSSSPPYSVVDDVECPSNDLDGEKNEENLDIKEEPYDPDFDSPNHCAQNASVVAGQCMETTLGKSSLRDDPDRTSNTNNTVTTEAEGERSASSGEALNSYTFPEVPKVKSEPGSEPEKYEIVCAKPKGKPNTPDYNNVILSCALLYSAMHGNTGNRAGPCSDGVQGVGCATPSIKQKTVEDNDDPTLCKAQKHHDDDDGGGCDTEPPSFGAECQYEEQAPFKRWTVTSSHLVPVREYKSHKTQTSLVRKNIGHGTQSSRRDKDEQDANESSMEARSGTSRDLRMSLAGQVKRGHEESAVGVNKRQKQTNVTTLEGTVVKQECAEQGNAEIRDSRFQCGLCYSNFSCMGGRAQHVSKVHLEEKNDYRNCGGTECEKLSYSTCHQAKLLRHMFAAHCDLVIAPSPYLKCKFCAMQFRDRTELEWHFYLHMQPTVSFRTDAGKPKPGWPRKDLKSKDASGSMAQFKCTMCTFESIQSAKVQLYTAAEARDHLAWHWLTQLPPEIRKSPNVLNFEISSDSIQRLYMIPHAPKANITCEFCGQTFTASSTHTHMTHWHRDYIRKPHRCMSPECKHLQFIRKQDFFGHMFSQHVSVIKRETFMFLCQICGKTFQNRSQVEWHCYVHRVRPAVSSRKGNAK
uniref:C2H2-type domain-containing protein n=1 Tax=Branchiostoma floridae TaxID=7739 RepID=C3XUM2_BRAFL|eukprot:XP_002612212.1 hypothetical protein BRAFLDRAFT_129265 [Branchiostoma floridae]